MASPEMERNPNAPLRLLSLDGGGVRGLSSLIILDSLMETIAAEEKRIGKRRHDDDTQLRPCDYFDLIGGTSTGGIIAILLGRLRLNCKQCIAIYSELAEQIFKHDRSIKLFGLRIPTGSSRFSGQVLERTIKSALAKHGYREDELMWDDSLLGENTSFDGHRDSIWEDAFSQDIITDSPQDVKTPGNSSLSKERETDVEAGQRLTNDTTKSYGTIRFFKPSQGKERGARTPARVPTLRLKKVNSVHRKPDSKGCRAFVVTSLKNAPGTPTILSTYDPNDQQTRIWEALRATSAAPTFFEEISFGTPKVTYLDGGMGFNNPCVEVDHAAKVLWGNRPIGTILSLGTGLQTIVGIKNAASWLPFNIGAGIGIAQALVSMSTSTQYTDNQLELMYPKGSSTLYHRYDVDGLQNISLEQWMKEDEISSVTQQYLSDPFQLNKAKNFGERMTKLSNLPRKFEVPAQNFKIGWDSKAVGDGSFKYEELDLSTGFPFGLKPGMDDFEKLNRTRNTSPSGKGGLHVDSRTGSLRKVYPVATDIDQDGKRQESVVMTCEKVDNLCLRSLRTGFSPGKYRVKFIVCFLDTEHVEPTEVVFSVGRPYDPKTFEKRYVDVKVTPDVVTVLLYPDAVRVRVGNRYKEHKGKSWTEIVGDVPVVIGMDGAIGLMITQRYQEDVHVGGWSFGGVQLEPIFDANS